MSLEGHFYTAANKLLDQDKLVENFISGADKRVKNLEVSQKKFVRCPISLNQELSELIDWCKNKVSK